MTPAAYTIFIMCLTTTYCVWNWRLAYPPHPRWLREYGRRDEARRYRVERRLTLAVTVLTLAATNGMLAFIMPSRG
jgi:hypothetical protein